MSKFRHPAWLSEKEIGDKLWENPEKPLELFLNCEKIYREFWIGKGRVDFATFSKETNTITLIELKITADINSVVQLVTYARNLKIQLHKNGLSDVKIRLALLARYFDEGVTAFCDYIEILAEKLEVSDSKDVCFSHAYSDRFIYAHEGYPDHPKDAYLQDVLGFFKGGENV